MIDYFYASSSMLIYAFIQLDADAFIDFPLPADVTPVDTLRHDAATI